MPNDTPTAAAAAQPLDPATATANALAILHDVAAGHTKLDRGHADALYKALKAGSLKIVAA